MHRSKLTLFSQISKLIDRNLVNNVVSHHRANLHSKGFPLWNQLMCMLFCHLSNAHSIRDIVYGMCSTTGNLHHIDIRRLPKRSTLSYANQHRNWEVFRDIYLKLYEQLSGRLSGARIKFRIKSKIYLLDSSLISLSLKVFDWAKYRQQKGAMKLHTLLDYQGAMPEYIHMSEGRESDLIHAREMHFAKGSVLVADRGYLDFNLLQRWDQQQKIRFVVRARKKMIYRVIKHNPCSEQNIVSDQIIRLSGIKGGRKYKKQLRRVEVWDEENEKTIILLTNVTRSWTAKTISQLYRARWEIELFFKDIKQHLKIKSFIGTTVNAVLIQIWTAMITLLLLKYLKAQATYPWHMSNLVSFIRFNLLVPVNLFVWLNKPVFVSLRGSPDPLQYELFD